LRMMFEAGSRVPVHCTASGKLLLAAAPEDTRERILSTIPLPRHTDNTITDPKEFKREMQRISKRGYSTDDEEYVTGLACVAVPIKGRGGQVFAAIACHAPVARMDLKMLVSKVPRLTEAADRLARTFL
jgi:IclR family transcriptional regulator, acetate operon repressor